MGQFSFFIIFVKILIDNIVLVFAIQHESVIIIHICMYVYIYIYIFSQASLVAQLARNLPAMWETWVWSLG